MGEESLCHNFEIEQAYGKLVQAYHKAEDYGDAEPMIHDEVKQAMYKLLKVIEKKS